MFGSEFIRHFYYVNKRVMRKRFVDLHCSLLLVTLTASGGSILRFVAWNISSCLDSSRLVGQLHTCETAMVLSVQYYVSLHRKHNAMHGTFAGASSRSSLRSSRVFVSLATCTILPPFWILLASFWAFWILSILFAAFSYKHTSNTMPHGQTMAAVNMMTWKALPIDIQTPWELPWALGLSPLLLPPRNDEESRCVWLWGCKLRAVNAANSNWTLCSCVTRSVWLFSCMELKPLKKNHRGLSSQAFHNSECIQISDFNVLFRTSDFMM